MSHTITEIDRCLFSTRRGSNENQNTIIRRFASKGTKLSKLTDYDVKQIQDYMNGLPRKILNYCTPWELFCQELKKIKVLPAIFS